MQNIAETLGPEPAPPDLSLAPKPLYYTGTQVMGWGRDGSWEAFKDDLSALYTCNSRWLGGRFMSWTLEAKEGLAPLRCKRSGYFDTEIGVYYFRSGKV